jgi:hypothetical protein
MMEFVVMVSSVLGDGFCGDDVFCSVRWSLW